MENDVCLLITVYCKATQSLLKCALKVSRDKIGDDVVDYPMEPENKEKLYTLLPLHIRGVGPIVDVSNELFEVCLVV